MDTSSHLSSSKRTPLRAKAWLLFYFTFTGLLFLASSLEAKPIQVFVLAGDESVLQNGLMEPGKKAKSPAGTLVDVVTYNEVAAKVMRENGVIINDLNAETFLATKRKGVRLRKKFI